MRKPVNALYVDNLEKSLEFYRNVLRFRVEWSDSEVAQIASTEGPAMLLSVRSIADLRPWMNEPYSVVPPGGRLYFVTSQDLNSLQETLNDRGRVDATFTKEKDDSCRLSITDPDGYTISLWRAPSMLDDLLLERLEQSGELLAGALRGLTDDQLNLRRSPEKWSIRQTVHHVAHSDATSLIRMLMAAAEPGRSFQNNMYNQDLWVESLGVETRPVTSAIALIHASRLHVASLLKHLPNALDRTLETSLGGTVSLRTMVAMAVGHTAGHTEQIWETRRVHGLV